MVRRNRIGPFLASLLILLTCLKLGAASAQESAPVRGAVDEFAAQDRQLYTPGPPILRRLDPREGLVDTQIRLVLEGEGFRGLGKLVEVIVAGVPVPIREFAPESDNLMVVSVYLPPELPPGDTGIAFIFENHRFEEPFHVRGREPGTGPPEEPRGPRVTGLSPHEGEANADIDLLLEGEYLPELGELLGVTIGGVDIPIRYRDTGSNDRWVIGVHLPEETPRGDQRLEFLFQNARFAEPFLVTSRPTGRTTPGIPPVVIIVIVVVTVLGGGAVLRRLLRRKPEPTRKEHPDRSRAPQPTIEFVVRVDPGTQSVELRGPSIIARR